MHVPPTPEPLRCYDRLSNGMGKGRDQQHHPGTLCGVVCLWFGVVTVVGCATHPNPPIPSLINPIQRRRDAMQRRRKISIIRLPLREGVHRIHIDRQIYINPCSISVAPCWWFMRCDHGSPLAHHPSSRYPFFPLSPCVVQQSAEVKVELTVYY